MLRYAKELQDWSHTAQAEIGLGLMALNLNQLDIGERRFQEVLNRAEEKSDIELGRSASLRLTSPRSK